MNTNIDIPLPKVRSASATPTVFIGVYIEFPKGEALPFIDMALAKALHYALGQSIRHLLKDVDGKPINQKYSTGQVFLAVFYVSEYKPALKILETSLGDLGYKGCCQIAWHCPHELFWRDYLTMPGAVNFDIRINQLRPALQVAHEALRVVNALCKQFQSELMKLPQP